MTKALSEVQHRLPTVAGAIALKFFKDSFQKQGWQGETFQPWHRSNATSAKNKGRAILVKTARLKRSPRVIRKGSASVTLGTDVPYAAAHNYGFKGTVQVREHTRNKYKKTRVGTGKYTAKGTERTRTVSSVSSVTTVSAHTRKMNIPKNQFMGDSPYLRQQVTRGIAAEIMKAAKRI